MNRVGKINTQTLLLVGAGVIALYLFTRKTTTVAPIVYPPGYNPYAPVTPAGNTTAGIITAAGSALTSIFSNIDF